MLKSLVRSGEADRGSDGQPIPNTYHTVTPNPQKLISGTLLAPISGVLPTVGAAYVAKAFITVISGGTAILAGTAAASSLFGSVNQLLTYFTTPVIGEAGLLAAAILLLRVLPHGITGKLFKGSL